MAFAGVSQANTFKALNLTVFLYVYRAYTLFLYLPTIICAYIMPAYFAA